MPRLCHAILYDADEKGRAALAYGFEVDGLKVTATADVETARGLVTVTPGEVVIVVVRENDAGGIPLARRLAETAETRGVPRLVLAEAPALPEPLRGLEGPAGFLSLPAFVRDVVTSAKLLAAGAGTTPGQETTQETTFEGALSDLGLFFIVRCMVGLGLSGIVEVERGARKGELRFHQGEIVSAQVGGLGNLEGPAALHQLLLWEEAALVMRFRETVRRGQTFAKGEELLDDCARFLRDFEHATRSIGHAQSLFVQDAEKTASLLDVVPQELVPVMRLFDGHRNLGDVLEDSPFRVFDTLRSVARLIELGTIRRKAIEKPSTGLHQGQRKPKGEDWLSRSSELPALGITTPAVGPGVPPVKPVTLPETRPLGNPITPTPTDASASATRARRSFRRKTGEHAIAPAPAPGIPGAPVTLASPTGGDAAESDNAVNGTGASASDGSPASSSGTHPTAAPTSSAETSMPETSAPAAPVEPDAASRPTPAAAEAVPVAIPVPVVAAAPVPEPVVAAPAVPAPLPPRKAKGGIHATHGELSGAASDATRRTAEDVPKILIELGPDLQAEAELASPPQVEDRAAEAAPLSPIEPPASPLPSAAMPPSPNPEPTSPSSASPAPTTPAPTTPGPRTTGVHAAEIDTGMRPPPPPELLEAPSGGPSIMIDPGFSEEMDAFELANSEPTPPPAVMPPPTEAPAPAPAAAAAASEADPVVSFVRGVSAARSALANTTFNAAPTVPVSALPPSARPATHAPPPAEPTPPPAGATATAPEAHATAPATSAPSPEAVPAAAAAAAPAEPASEARSQERRERRASGEFDALESEFFARESELYKRDTVENFDDLDHGLGKGKGGKPGKGPH